MSEAHAQFDRSKFLWPDKKWQVDLESGVLILVLAAAAMKTLQVLKEARGASSWKTTFEKWQREHELEYSTLTWLRCHLDQDQVHVSSLFCTVCKKYERNVSSMKSFSPAWIEGSSNLRLSNMLDHAQSEVHKNCNG